MKAKFGAIVVDGRGKINGFVASRNTYGAYFRTKVTPANPNTTAQALVRGQFTGVSQAWRGLTQPQRQGWFTLATQVTRTNIFGDSVPLTAFNLFMRLNRNLQAIGIATLTNAPTLAAVTSLTTLSVIGDVGDNNVVVTFAPTPVPASHSLLIRSTGPVSAGIKFVKSQFRQIVVAPAASGTGLDITNEYVTRFGTLVAGQSIYFEAFLVNTLTGLDSGRLQARCVVTA